MSALEDLMKGRRPATAEAPTEKPSRKTPKAPKAPESPLVAAPAKPRRRITEPGIYELSEEDYHADCCPEPSLSASIAKKLVGQSPAHARHAHPRLNPGFASEEKEIFDRGTVAHALLLQGIEAAVVLDFDDWRTKDAKANRDAVRADGKIPILRKYWDAIIEMVDRCREQLAQHKEASDAFTEGKPEQTLIWREDNGVWCRAKLDWLNDDRRKIFDYKSTGRNAGPDDIQRIVFSDGWDVQESFYRRGVRRLTGIDPAFQFVVQESTEPYAASVIGFGPDIQWLGDEKVDLAIKQWGRCLKAGVWPGYPDRVCYPMLPKWEEEKWIERTGGR